MHAATPKNAKKPASRKRAKASSDMEENRDESAGELSSGDEDDDAVDSKRRVSNAHIETADILPPRDTLLWSVCVDSPTFLKNIVATTKSMKVDDLTLWLSNNTASYEAAKADAESKGQPCTMKHFCGISIDSMDSSRTIMAVARMPLSPDSVNIYTTRVHNGEEVPCEEVGITVNTKMLLNTVSGCHDYKRMVIFQSRPPAAKGKDGRENPRAKSSRCEATVLLVAATQDPLFLDLPLLDASDREHVTIGGWAMQLDLSMTLEGLQEVIKFAANYEADVIRMEMKKWSKKGFILLMYTNHAGPNVYKEFHITYTTSLKKGQLTPEVQQAIKVLEEVETNLTASDKSKDPAVQRQESGLETAEREVKRHIFALYDSLAVPEGFVKPARRSTLDSPLEFCETEMRALQAAVREKQLADSTPASASEFVCGVDTTQVELASSFSAKVAGAPFHREDIEPLETVYDAWFSVSKLQNILKAPNKCANVQLHVPKAYDSPLVIRFDTGGGDSESFIACVMAPKVSEEDA